MNSLEERSKIPDSSLAESNIEETQECKNYTLSKRTLSFLRTTLRNNIKLTSIADNKANVLLSLNALMLTFLVPLIFPYLDTIVELNLELPLVLLTITCLSTIYLAANVLKPSRFQKQNFKDINSLNSTSPFFFGNFLHMEKYEFLEYSEKIFKDKELVSSFITNDFYHIGHRLAEKMKTVRLAYNIFIYGMTASIISMVVLLIINI